MPYVDEGALNVPPQETKIWRYMDFTKFVNLIGTRKLFLCQASCLGDPEEGKLPEPVKEAVKNPVYTDDGITPQAGEFLFNLTKAWFDKDVYINCWHMNENESDAMWHRYTGSSHGIAIQSTIGRLIESIDTFNGKLRIGAVRYTNYKEIGPEGLNPIAYFTRKRLKYKHEEEVRMLYVKEVNDVVDHYGNGIRVDVDIEKLIEKIYLPPQTNLLEFDTTQLVSSTYGLNKEIIVLNE